MVSLKEVQSSNSHIASALPRGLVAVFVGGTNGIGETTLVQFSKQVRKPRVYFICRSQEAGDRIKAQCEELNSEGELTFIRADTSLIRNVDEICQDIKSKEKAINLLFLSTGTLVAGKETAEGLKLAAALVVHSRTRFLVNLLPLLQNATALRRVVSVFTGGKEGAIDTTDFQGWKLPWMAQRGHASSIVTLSLEAVAKQAPSISYIHDFPGPVKSGIARDTTGVIFFFVKLIFALLGPFINMAVQESGERHLYLATSAKYPAVKNEDTAPGVPSGDDIKVARGSNGKDGSGVYSINWDGESAGPNVEELLANLRKEGMTEKVWEHTEEQFKRITGTTSA